LCKLRNFFEFFSLHRKTAAEVTQAIFDELKQKDLDAIVCRGQGYDNASAMSEIHAGVQRRNLKRFLFLAEVIH